MKLNSTAFAATGAAVVAAAYAAVFLSDHAEANPIHPTTTLVGVKASAAKASEVPAPRECKLDEGIDTACNFD